MKEKNKRTIIKNTEIIEKKELKNLKRNKKKILPFIFFLITSIFFLGFLLYLNAGFFIVALVNNKPVWRIELIRELEKQGGKQITEALINKLLVYQEAKNKGVYISNQDVDNEYKKLEEQFKSQGSNLQDIMALQGLKEKDLREEIKFNLLLNKLLADKTSVTDEEAKEYFEKNKEMFEKGKTFDELKDQIKNLLSSQKLSQAYQTFINELKSSSNIKYFVNFN